MRLRSCLAATCRHMSIARTKSRQPYCDAEVMLSENQADQTACLCSAPECSDLGCQVDQKAAQLSPVLTMLPAGSVATGEGGGKSMLPAAAGAGCALGVPLLLLLLWPVGIIPAVLGPACSQNRSMLPFPPDPMHV